MLKWLLEVVSENTKKLVGGGLAAIVIGGSVTIWIAVEARIKSFIVSTVAEEAIKDNSQLSEAFKSVVANTRKSEVGAMSVGNFLLTPSNRRFTLYVYFPDGYKGKLFYSLKGDVIPGKRYVVLAGPNQKPEPLSLNKDDIILEKYFRQDSAQAAMVNDFLERAGSSNMMQNSLRPITFQLEGSDTDDEQLSKARLADADLNSPLKTPSIEISYLTLITPAIQMSQ